MTPEPSLEPEGSPEPGPSPESQFAGAPRHLLLGGVAVACVLGVGLGLWARPAQSERRAIPPAGAPQKAVPAVRSLQIVFDERPAEIGAPLEVMTAQGEPTPVSRPAPPLEPAEPPAPAPTPIQPAREGLMRVQDVAPPTRSLQPAVLPQPLPAKVEARPAVKPVPAAKPKPAPAEKPKAKAEPKLVKAKTTPAKSKPPALKAKVEKAEKKETATAARKGALKVAKAEPPRKAKKAEVVLAKSEPKAKPRLVKLLGKLKTKKEEPRRAVQVAEAKPARVKVQKVRDAAPKPKLEKAVVRRPAEKPKPVKIAAKPAKRCATSDPGADAVCADRTLQAADREMARAYRQAEAAGAPSWRLQQQHQRWLAARAAAAREAPWAVRDVYQARIAELRDMSRSAQGEY